MIDTPDRPGSRRSPKPPRDDAATDDPREARRRRQAEALRANLRRRKEVIRATGETADATGTDDHGTPGDAGR